MIRVLFVIACCLSTIGCASIPKQGSVLAGEVGVGITRLQQQTEAIIHALAEVERGIVDEQWENMYRRAERMYREQESLADNHHLDLDQRIDVATITASHRENILTAIASKEAELIQATRANMSQVLELNEAVRRYLLSLESYDQARTRTREVLSGLTGVDVDSLIGLGRRLLGNPSPH